MAYFLLTTEREATNADAASNFASNAEQLKEACAHQNQLLRDLPLQVFAVAQVRSYLQFQHSSAADKQKVIQSFGFQAT